MGQHRIVDGKRMSSQRFVEKMGAHPRIALLPGEPTATSSGPAPACDQAS